MPPKRKASSQKSAAGGGPAKRKKITKPAMVNLAKKIVVQQLNRNIETKQSNRNIATTNVLHNKLSLLDSQLLATSPGVNDPMSTDTSNRIGDEISLRGISIRFLMEMSLNHSDCTYRAMVIKSAKGDAPNVTSLFNGLTTCKLIDRVNTERFTVLYSKTFKLTARNMTIPGRTTEYQNQIQGVSGPSTGVGYNDPTVQNMAYYADYQAQGKATRIVNIWIPGKKIVRNGVVRYENGISQPKFFDYHFCVYAYANGDANVDPTQNVFCGTVKHYISQMYYKDA